MEDYWHWLCSAFAPETEFMERLLAVFGTPKEIFGASEKDATAFFKREEGRKGTEERKKKFRETRRMWDGQEKRKELEAKGLRFISCEHREFPLRLVGIPHAPKGLFVRGSLPSENCPSLAVVGARNCSPYGKNLALQFAQVLGEKGIQIVSGMARGIDGYAHRGAIKGGGKTFAVLGGGVDLCYPYENRDIFERIGEGGGVLSESPPGTPGLPWLFPVRNRIISGLSDAVLIIEARLRSGSLLTADLALEQGRDVFAVPGRLGDSLSAGCNNLIRQGAGIALSPEKLLEDLEITPEFNREKAGKPKILLESTEDIVYSCLRLQARNLEEICSLTSLPVSEVLRVLVKLELKGYIREVQKNYYCKNKIE